MNVPLYPRCVVKVGGSLLRWQPFPNWMRRWLSRRGSVSHLLVVGGGELVDPLRCWDQRFGMPTSLAHELAVDSLSITARCAAHWLQLPTPCSDWRRLRCQWGQRSPDAAPDNRILDPAPFVREQVVEPGVALPVGWHVTTDSIAARAAECFDLPLVLLKSAEPTEPFSPAWASAQGYCDEWFEQACRNLPHVHAVNLRSGWEAD